MVCVCVCTCTCCVKSARSNDFILLLGRCLEHRGASLSEWRHDVRVRGDARAVPQIGAK